MSSEQFMHPDDAFLTKGPALTRETLEWSVPGRAWWGSHGVLIGSLFLGLCSLVFIGIAEESLLATVSISVAWGALATLLLNLEGADEHFPRMLIRMFWITFCLRLCATVLLHTALGATAYAPWWDFGTEGGDEGEFWLNSDRLVEAWQNGTILQEEALEFQNYFAWLQIIGLTRFFGGHLSGDTVFNVRVALCMAGALTVPYVYATANRLFNERVAGLAALLAFCLPDYWFYSSTIMRDVLICCVNVILFYQILSMMDRGLNPWRLVLAVGLNFFVIRYLRMDLAFVNVAMIALFVTWGKTERLSHLIPRLLTLCVAGAILLAILGVLMPQTYSLDALSVTRVLDVRHIEFRASWLKDFALDNEVKAGSFGAVVLQLPLYMRWPVMTVITLLSPVPPWGPITEMYADFPLKAVSLSVCAVVWYCFMCFFPAGLVRTFRMDLRKTVWLWGPVLILAVELGFASGSQPRWRMMFLPFMLIILAHGMLIWKQRPYFYLTAATSCTIVLGLISYWILKL